ncbi:hypothetical protein AJ79_09001 [Helicocarpus griseus UAMH5409]|uniref:Cyanovirin-N domain-containing protein n=1 Tax=Helicocarpus griseus UAMH5409 TaxID=1447875 RepID=A0A2B7WNA8_9EURO|nr:hypothetical protein AJ79_09001 [Helicocarpus griseus UAMH5409]
MNYIPAFSPSTGTPIFSSLSQKKSLREKDTTMKLTLFTTLFVLACLLLSVSADYTKSCKDCKIGKYKVLECKCSHGKNKPKTTKLNLDRCLMNSKGTMKPKKE